ncbi:SDR family NAD(P)-dependent oxidoreductase [Novosphingobium sp. JCM 18896]|uniref:SDR family NAD(P)-dependent oxidoreductase n=1 Tax=Novosphingobium sp. JCM 18896 TaxID=2989731 RepID=UPI002223C64D|nr:SDR family NAD(P)-dependent oxidoreductase [Novosphingobium sp. JCM 18896]MCW1432420.1 SDR family oxidoreductase [Novosphingobium sp. JCM 18896]
MNKSVSDHKIRLDEQVILVTGAGRGLGRAYALELAARGAHVIVADNGVGMEGEIPDQGPAGSVAAEIAAAGGAAIACTVDLADERKSAQAVEVARDAFGRIDGILHNASTVPELTPVDALSTLALERVLDINVKAGLWLARAAWPHFAAQGYGRMLYTTSAAIFGAAGNASYAAAKGAVLGMVRCLAVDGKSHGICVNALAPSARTRMTETFLSSDYGEWLRRTMPPEKVTGAAAFLMSDACSLTGEILAVGGGRVARIALTENEGVILPDPSAEAVCEALPEFMTDAAKFHSATLEERSATVAALLGYPED